MESITQEKKKKIVEVIAVIVLILIGLIARVAFWPNAISQINCDEAMSAINAKAIAETGKDMYGTSFPVYFETWQYGGQSAMLIYIMACCIKIFGFSIFSIRLPLLLVSLLSLLIFYDLAKRCSQNRKIALLSLRTIGYLSMAYHAIQMVY